MAGESERMQAALPRTVRLMERAIQRLGLKSVPPFSYNAGLAVFAVSSALLLPRLLDGVPGSLLAMQALALMAIAMLILFLGLRQLIWRDILSRPDPVHDHARPEIWTWSFDAFFVLLLALSFKLGGPLGPLEFLALVGATIVGAIRGEHDRTEIAAIAARFVLAAAALAVVATIFGLPQDQEHWAGAPGSTLAAGVYFGALTLAEAVGLYPPASQQLLRVFEKIQRRLTR
jgi:hypothetical protein